ncbi:MAG TPA: enoyl-CoA hydratase/isomerase family protein [Burkholderiales bacterium]|nr:enoyl-CoA hydratase/isomerase family protein [Burkholderiales bacterium]
MASVELERTDSTAVVVLNRPQVLNAVDAEMREALITLLGEINRDEAVRAVVIRGAGERAFCAGQDLDETARYGLADIDGWLTRLHAMYAAVRNLDKPCIVAWNGIATGAGFQIGLCADLRVGYPELKLGQPEIKAGLASITGSWLMTLHLGLAKNIELSLTGNLISGAEAQQLGLVNHLVPREAVVDKALAVAAELSRLPPTATRLTKQRLRRLTQPGFDAVLDEAKAAQRVAYESGEPQAAMKRFLEARNAKKS